MAGTNMAVVPLEPQRGKPSGGGGFNLAPANTRVTRVTRDTRDTHVPFGYRGYPGYPCPLGS